MPFLKSANSLNLHPSLGFLLFQGRTSLLPARLEAGEPGRLPAGPQPMCPPLPPPHLCGRVRLFSLGSCSHQHKNPLQYHSVFTNSPLTTRRSDRPPFLKSPSLHFLQPHLLSVPRQSDFLPRYSVKSALVWAADSCHVWPPWTLPSLCSTLLATSSFLNTFLYLCHNTALS